MSRFIVAALATLCLTTPAAAITLAPGQAADFTIDLSGLGDFNWSRYGYACNDASCDSNGPGRLAAGASFQFQVGSSMGGAQFGAVTYTQHPAFGIEAVSTPLGLTQLIPSGTDTVYVRIQALDDAFFVGSVILSEGLGGRSVVGTQGALAASAVPLPASAGFALLGLAALAGLRRRPA